MKGIDIKKTYRADDKDLSSSDDPIVLSPSCGLTRKQRAMFTQALYNVLLYSRLLSNMIFLDDSVIRWH